MGLSMPAANIIIRTLNEENWIRFSLDLISKQTFKDFKITIVDSGSADRTVDLCDGKADIIRYVGEYFPGKAINLGIDFSCDFQIIVSAHCLPKNNDWLSGLLNALNSNQDCVAAYGRQLPMDATHPDDYRDLVYTFSNEDKIQNKDPMFHNANSIVRTSFLKKIPFNEEVKHLEDRIWGEEVIQAGYKIAYTAEAAVYHYHGLHQHGLKKSFRADGVRAVLQNLLAENPNEESDYSFELDLKIPFILSSLKSSTINKALSLADEIKDRFDNPIIILSLNEDLSVNDKKSIEDIPCIQTTKDASFGNWIYEALILCEDNLKTIIDGLTFIDLNYKNSRLDLARACRTEIFKGMQDFICPAWSDTGNYYKYSKKLGYEEVSFDFKTRDTKTTFYRTIFGQGSTIRSSIIRRNKGNTIHPDQFITTNNVLDVARND